MTTTDRCARCTTLMVGAAGGRPGALVAALGAGLHPDCLLVIRREAREALRTYARQPATVLADPDVRRRRVQLVRLEAATHGVVSADARAGRMETLGRMEVRL